MIKNWLHIFLYNIRNNKFFTALNVLGLSMGISGLIFAILYWNEEHSYNAWNPDSDHIFQVITDVGSNTLWATTTEPVGRLLLEDKSIESYCYTSDSYDGSVIYYDGKKQVVDKIYNAQRTFFDFFPFRFIKGNAKTAFSKEYDCVLSENTAKRLFGDANPIGKTLQYGNNSVYVKGVYTIPGKSSVAPEMVVCMMQARLDENKDVWNNFNYNMFLKLKNPKHQDAIGKKIVSLYYTHRLIPECKNRRHQR
ncbi:ABC transporter permease [Flavobacterium sp. 3HN19-14]|uniref:ABC transporter permease n=1 Tax=Flavobacterium sp. 3HN19-14 TaxID=3448133 RepID=UPI003EDF86DF